MGRARRWPLFSACDVAKHDTEDDVWLIANGKVYDVTDFLTDHPGGARSIMMHAGRDATQDLLFHSPAAQKRWGTFQVGLLSSCSNLAKGGGCPQQRCAIQ